MRQMSDLVRNQQPLMLPPSASIIEAARQMRDRRVGAVLVVSDARLVGIFTGRDAVDRVLAEGKSPASITLADVMTPNPDTMPPQCTAIEALRLMQDAHCRHLPIVEGERVISASSRTATFAVSNRTAWMRRQDYGSGLVDGGREVPGSGQI